MTLAWRLALLTAILTVSNAAFGAPRDIRNIDSGWRFIREDVPGAETASFADASWQNVDVPHCWNNIDGQDGGSDYYRGVGWYRRHFGAPRTWAGRLVYLRFGAASNRADVYVNGKLVGSHQGGFSAFTFDITSDLNVGGDNIVAVKVDNSRSAEILPLGGDFTVNGGIYRDVTLEVTDSLCISPLDDSSNGVYVRQDSVSLSEAKLAVTAVIRNASHIVATARVHCEIAGVQADASQQVPADGSVSVELPITVPKPHLWNGLRDPFQYPVTVSVSGSREAGDSVVDKVGLRFFSVDPQSGFILNGQPYRLYGVNRHQDKLDKGWAISQDDEKADYGDIVDLGCTAVRLSHYQQSPSFYSLCDGGGVIVWAELPLVSKITMNSPAFDQNAEQQLRELIKQNFNHPSICFWGLFNELKSSKDAEPDELTLLKHLKKLAHQLDPTRLTTGASNKPPADKLALAPDLAAYNRYTGWYGGDAADWGKTLDDIHIAHPDHPCGISEYGAGGSIFQHSPEPITRPKTTGEWHPEEYQSDVLEHAWSAINDRPWIWGSFMWCLHDFASDGRAEGDHLGRNDKGLVTYDGKTRKDAFYFFQANWSSKPMVYIADRRYTPRATGVGSIKVYSNCDRVELIVNGQSLGSVQPNKVHVFVWPNATLKPGTNLLECKASRAGITVGDQCKVVVNKSSI